MSHNIHPSVWTIPRKVKANCYAFGLAVPFGKGGLANRPHKSQPGEKCGIRDRLQFHTPALAARQIHRRILCDNPDSVAPVMRTHLSDLWRDLPEGYHLMACVLSPEISGHSGDFHFFRRMHLSSIVQNHRLMKTLAPEQASALRDAKRTGERAYVWVHQRGWSGDGPQVTDAAGEICWTPIPHEAHKSVSGAVQYRDTQDFNYGSLNYSVFVRVYVVHSGQATVNSSANSVVPIDAFSAPMRRSVRVYEALRRRATAAPRPSQSRIMTIAKHFTRGRNVHRRKSPHHNRNDHPPPPRGRLGYAKPLATRQAPRMAMRAAGG